MSTSWVLDAIGLDRLYQARTEASRRLLSQALNPNVEMSEDLYLRFAAEGLELAAIDLLEDEEHTDELRKVCADAFQMLRVLPRPNDPMDAAKAALRMVCVGILGDRSADASRLLKEAPWPALPVEAPSWGDRTLATILDVWLYLIRKAGWADLHTIQQRIIMLRQQQSHFEAEYLNNPQNKSRTAAWELIALYHLAKVAEILATFTGQGEVAGYFDVYQQIEAQFDRALIACNRAELVEMHDMVRLLARTGRQMVDNSIWTVTRGATPRVSRFVQQLVTSQRRPIFEVLPPQRRALREEGLLGAAHRSVVVNLPTSSGKTFIAEFRILQALNQFDEVKGWVAYLVPTRALVNQICVRLRRDFSDLGIPVERVSPALEVDGLEASVLADGTETGFRVLVTTPEKLDLMLRTGWEAKIGRPLTLIVVDEAHNLGQTERGIRLELLLATVNRECRDAQFLLLTPFIDNADEIARWLDPSSNKDVSIGLEWVPNDRAIVLSKPICSNDNTSFEIALETVHTGKSTLVVPENLSLGSNNTLNFTCRAVSSNASDLAAATAYELSKRGPVIVLASRPDWAWGLARRFKCDGARCIWKDNLQRQDIELVQRYLSSEYGADFELCELLAYGVGVHHAGLSDEAKGLMEWLLENERIQILVATTTVAQGVNFPVSGVVLAHKMYYDSAKGRSVDMPPEDFWNIAGRAGRVDQGSVGIVALAAVNDESASALRNFVNRRVESLNSTLIAMVQNALMRQGELELHRLFNEPEWSAFLQYLAHTYRQIGDPVVFGEQVEQVLRGTLGFQNLRHMNPEWANKLVISVQDYASRIAGKPLSLVDSTGFSWESVSLTLRKLAQEHVTEDIWDPKSLFGTNTYELRKLMGILLQVPELRANLTAATGGLGPDGGRLASMVRDWVTGASISEMSREYFGTNRKGQQVDLTTAVTNCCRNLFGKLIQTTSWGLAALETLTFGEAFDRLSEVDQQMLRNVPAKVFYGVSADDAIALRLLGVPRGAAQPLAERLTQQVTGLPLSQIRTSLSLASADVWSDALGGVGHDYYRVWRILEGLE